jgi:tRNA U34 5-methylaminomethyl-2-thiouridine-forming methyltransferase MnmC
VSAFERVTLRNGERALRERATGEIMHPSVGPWAEAKRLYVEQSRLETRLAATGTAPVRVYDVGLGGAANAVAALDCARGLGERRRRPLELVSFEQTVEPLELALADPEGFPFLVPWRAAIAALLSEGSWSDAGASWKLVRGDLLETLARAPSPAELVYFDPFSPKANPALWTVEALGALRGRLSEDPAAELFTYSAATPTRVSLLLAGFFVGAGVSVATKAETTVAATQRTALAEPLGQRWLERWSRSSHRAPHGRSLSDEVERAVRSHPQFTRT